MPTGKTELMAIRCVVCIDCKNDEDYGLVNKPSPKPTGESKHAAVIVKPCKETTEPYNPTYVSG